MTKRKETPKKRGYKAAPVEELAARGSEQVAVRKRAEQDAKDKAKLAQLQPVEWVPPTCEELDALIRTLPRYDPFADADGCWFDCEKAKEALRFFGTELRFMEGKVAGKPFKLEWWQQAIVANLFGWYRQAADGSTVRRFTEALIYVSRKQGKTPLAAGICLYLLLSPGEAGKQIVSMAYTRDQAGLLYRQANGMVRQNPRMVEAIKVYGGAAGQSKALYLNDDPGSAYRIIAQEAHGQHGLTLTAAIVDELHAFKTREPIDTLRTSFASANRPDPLLIYITTADYLRDGSPCNERREHAEKVLTGIVSDPQFLPVVFEAPKDAAVDDRAAWKAANPNLGISVSEEFLERESVRAKNDAAYENVFRRLHLNQQTEVDTVWVSIATYDKGAAPAFDEEGLIGQTCYAGLDLSATKDLTALKLVFPDVDGNGERIFWEVARYWCPGESIARKSKEDKVPYDVWERRGLLLAAHTETIDHDLILNEVLGLSAKFRIVEIGIDPMFAPHLINRFQEHGLVPRPFPNNYAYMTAPLSFMEKVLIQGRLKHNGHPVSRWCQGNAAVQRDNFEHMRLSKRDSKGRIDGVSASAMALGCALQYEGVDASDCEAFVV